MSQENKFYVYVHRYASGPKKGQVFYVGKGRDDRLKIKNGRNSHWENVVNKYGFTVEVVMWFAEETCALSFERILIALYGRESLTNKTDGGEGVSGIEFSDIEIQRRRECISGSHHPSYDYKSYEFIHETGDLFIGTSYEFHKKYKFPNSAIRKLVRDKFRSYKGWMIKGRERKELGRKLSNHHFWGVSGPNNPVCKKDVFSFKSADGSVFTGTRSEFYTKYELNRSSVSALVNGKQKIHKGWTVHEV